MLAQLSRETGIPLVATNDVHYISKEDAEMQQVLICIQTNHTLGEDTGMEFQTQEFYLKSEQEMLSLFPEYPDAVERTSEIAERCNVEFEFGKTKLPHFEVPGAAATARISPRSIRSVSTMSSRSSAAWAMSTIIL